MTYLRKFLGLLLSLSVCWLIFLFSFQGPGDTTRGASQASEDGVNWTSFCPGSIPVLTRQGKVVFVDITASWCVTCQFNKHNVLQSRPVTHVLRAPNVVAMRADWTKPNTSITSFLKRFHRAGIPFQVVIGPGAPGGIVLPEILTQNAVLQAIKAAQGG